MSNYNGLIIFVLSIIKYFLFYLDLFTSFNNLIFKS